MCHLTLAHLALLEAEAPESTPAKALIPAKVLIILLFEGLNLLTDCSQLQGQFLQLWLD